MTCPLNFSPRDELELGLEFNKGGRDEEKRIYSRADRRKTAGDGGIAQPGVTIGEVSRKLGITEQTYYR